MKSLLLLLILLVHGSCGYRVLCVYTNWSQYRPEGAKFFPEDVDPSLCTHLIYVYAKLKVNKLEPTEWNDEGSAWSEGMYERVNNLKQINPEMKTLLGVGGWMMGSKDFSKLAGSRISRRIFAKTSTKFLRDRNFDGLTIDWQHPTKRGGKPQDKVNFSLLLKEIRQAFEAESKKSGLPPLLLTAGVSASREIIGDAYEIDNITKYTDFINVMAYDLHGAWDNYTGHPSQLYAREEEFGPSTEINVDAAMRYWMSNVRDRSKLVLGISTYGRTFTLRKSRHNDYNVPTTGPGLAGDFTQQPGMLAYYERCSQYADAPRIWNTVSQVAYWYSGDQWIAGEDVESVKAKVNWTRTYEIGGVMIWSLDTDDFTDKCLSEPLLNTVVTALNDPTFVKPNVSIEELLAKSNSNKQNPSNSKTPKDINMMLTTVATTEKGSSSMQTTTSVLVTTKKETERRVAKQDSSKIVKEEQKQQQTLSIESKHQRKLQAQGEAGINKGKAQVKRTGKRKMKKRLNPKLRRKVLLSKRINKHRSPNHRHNKSNKILRNDNKPATEKINLSTKSGEQTRKNVQSLKSTDNKKATQTSRNNEQNRSVEHRTELLDRNIVNFASAKGTTTEKSPIADGGKSLRIVSKTKQASVRILRRKINRVKKPTNTNGKERDHSSNSVTTAISADNHENIMLKLSSNVTKKKDESNSVLYSTSFPTSTTISPVQLKEFQKQVKKTSQKGKILRRGKRRRRKKRPTGPPNPKGT